MTIESSHPAEKDSVQKVATELLALFEHAPANDWDISVTRGTLKGIAAGTITQGSDVMGKNLIAILKRESMLIAGNATSPEMRKSTIDPSTRKGSAQHQAAAREFDVRAMALIERAASLGMFHDTASLQPAKARSWSAGR